MAKIPDDTYPSNPTTEELGNDGDSDFIGVIVSLTGKITRLQIEIDNADENTDTNSKLEELKELILEREKYILRANKMLKLAKFVMSGQDALHQETPIRISEQSQNSLNKLPPEYRDTVIKSCQTAKNITQNFVDEGLLPKDYLLDDIDFIIEQLIALYPEYKAMSEASLEPEIVLEPLGQTIEVWQDLLRSVQLSVVKEAGGIRDWRKLEYGKKTVTTLEPSANGYWSISIVGSTLDKTKAEEFCPKSNENTNTPEGVVTRCQNISTNEYFALQIGHLAETGEMHDLLTSTGLNDGYARLHLDRIIIISDEPSKIGALVYRPRSAIKQ